MTFAIALAALLLTIASHVLHFTAPRTKSKLDDEGAKIVDSLKDAITGEVTK